MMEGADFTEDFDRRKWPGAQHWRGSAGYFSENSVNRERWQADKCLVTQVAIPVPAYVFTVDVLTVARQHMKGKSQSRSMVIHPEAKVAMLAWVEQMPEPWGPETYLFRSRKGGNRPLRRVQAWQILHDAYATNQLQGRLATHSMRKTFAVRLYERDHNLPMVQKALGHAAISSTGKYLESVTEDEMFAAVLGL
jgi:site-specific recombinase XerD